MSSDPLHDLLAADEPALFNGRPRGYLRPSRSDLLGYAALLGLAVFLIALGWWSVRSYATTDWSLSWQSLRFTGTSGGGTSGFSMPSPFAWVFLIAALELYRQAGARSLRLLITPRRVLTRSGVFRPRSTEFLRGGGEQVVSVQGGLRLVSLDGKLDLFLHGLDDADAAGLRTALETYDPGPTPPLPPPIVTGRRIAAVALVLLTCLSTIGWYRGTRQPATLRVTWQGGRLAAELEGPYWVDGRLNLTQIELQDQTGAVLKTNSSSAGGGTGLVRTYTRQGYPVPPTVQRLRIRIAAHRVDANTTEGEPVVPPGGWIELELQPNSERHLTLRPNPDGWLQPSE